MKDVVPPTGDLTSDKACCPICGSLVAVCEADYMVNAGSGFVPLNLRTEHRKDIPVARSIGEAVNRLSTDSLWGAGTD